MSRLLTIFLMLVSIGASAQVDWQGHRGARGLLPENTVPAFLKALEYNVTTLELDVCITADGQVVVSHEPWISSEIGSLPDGSPVPDSLAHKLKIWKMTLAEVQTYDVGKRGNPRFKDQKPRPAVKPSLAEVVREVRRYCESRNRPFPKFNIEIKSTPTWSGKFVPEPAEYTKLVLTEISKLLTPKQFYLQSFDPRILNEIGRQFPEVQRVLLVENKKSIAYNLRRVEGSLAGYSPHYMLLTPRKVKKLHGLGLKVIPWTVNDKAQADLLLKMGVDGIITDYPNFSGIWETNPQ